MEKPFVLRPSSDLINRMWIVLFTLTNGYNGWASSIHAPNFSPIWTFILIFFCLLIYFAFYRKLTMLNDKFIFQENFFSKKMIGFSNISYITGESDKNHYLTSVTIHQKNLDKPIKIGSKELNNFSRLVKALRNIAHDDRTAKFVLKDEFKQARLEKYNRLINLLCLILLVFFILAKFSVKDVHVAFLYETQWANFGLIILAVVMLSSLVAIFLLWYKKNPFIDEYGNFIFGLILLYLLVAKTINVSIWQYNEYLIRQHQLNQTTLNATVIGSRSWQNWHIKDENFDKELMAFRLNDWQGANKQLVKADFDNTYDRPPKYQLKVYQDKFGYYVITPEQFAHAQPINQ